MASLIGRTLSHYEIVEEISRGGMGVVYRAMDTRLNREVAIKILPPDLIADSARRARFVQEARAASALEHPHIAVIHEIDEAGGVSFIAMELIRGEKLSDVVGRGPLAPARALDLAIEIAEGLSRAHDKGIVHRDLKPANVMLTEDGHAKIIDFGLAKLVDALSGDSGGETIVKAETDPGVVLGTVSYMSPEQARGGKVDHRSDVFSFGVLLHEILTGRPPFKSHTGIDTMHAILHDPVPPLPSLGGSVSVEAIRDVQRILEKCLAKDPGERYQGMRDIVVDLRAARRRLESTSASPVASASGRMTTRQGLMRAHQYVYYGMFLIAFVVAAIGGLQGLWKKPASPAAAASDKPSVAVLYFENNTGNPQLEWLRTGLTDMMVTDLSQSPDLEVLGTDRLVQILTDLRRQDDRVLAFDTVQEIAKRAGVKSVLLGSYVKAGDTIRINLKLQDAATGHIVTAERVEAASEANLFPTIDDLTRRIKSKVSLGGRIDPSKVFVTRPGNSSASAGPLDRDLKDVTTSSIEAYRHYAEGINLHERHREQEAIAPLERAVAIDPAFAMALAKLAVVHYNLRHPTQFDEYSSQAFVHIDRVTTREHYYVEGLYYSRRFDTFDKSIDAYRKAVELFPDHASARQNLAFQYELMERFQDAIPQYQELIQRSVTNVTAYTNLAFDFVQLGQFDRAYAVLQEVASRYPDNDQVQFGLGTTLAAWGKFDEAIAALNKAEGLAPTNLVHKGPRRGIFLLREQWSEVEAIDQTLRRSADPGIRFVGSRNLADDRLYKGRTTEALGMLSATVSMGRAAGSPQTADARNNSAQVLLATGRPASALAETQQALSDAHGVGPTPPRSLYLIAVAQAQLGHKAESENTAKDLERFVKGLPGDNIKRWTNHLAGHLALEQRDYMHAIEELKRAEAKLPPVPITPGTHNQAVAIWFDLGSAYLLAGDDIDASARFQRIVDGTTQRVWNPLEFVRSLYFLGQIAERQGDRGKAAAFYRRFVEYWGDGDIDRDRVADARKRIG